MMHSQNFDGFWAFGNHLHWIFIALFIVGLIFLTHWGIRNLSKDKLKNWTIALLLIGGIGMLITSTYSTLICPMHSGTKGNFSMMQHMMDDDHSKYTSGEEMREHMLEEMKELQTK